MTAEPPGSSPAGPTPGYSPTDAARLALACLDLTSLNDADTEADVRRLCERAQGPHGRVAAVCVWSRFAASARRALPASIAVAAVANFPDGGGDTARAVAETRAAVDAGADEVDVVLPHARLAAGDERGAAALLEAVRAASAGRVLKVILETGALADPAAIGRAARLALDAGADFLKTSTGRTPVGATPAAARALLVAIARDPASRVGLKVSGGVRRVAEAEAYRRLVVEILGPGASGPARFRIGASSLLDDIERLLGGAGDPGPDAGGY